MNRHLPIILLLVLLPTARIAEGAAPKFATKLQVAEKSLTLNGSGLCEYGFFAVDVYWAALYLESETRDPQVVINSEQVKRLQLKFARDLSAKQLRAAYTAAFQANTGKSLPRYKAGMDQLNAMMVAVKEGDSLYFTYDPKAACLEVTLNRRKLGTIKGTGWCQMFFELYVGKHPPDESMKNELLGKK